MLALTPLAQSVEPTAEVAALVDATTEHGSSSSNFVSQRPERDPPRR